MKNFKTFMACAGMLSLILVFITSCGKETSIQPVEKVQTEATQLGKLHNEGLDHLLGAYTNYGIDQLKAGGASTIIPFTVDQTVAFWVNEKNYAGDPEQMRSTTLKTLEKITNTATATTRDDDEEIIDIIQSSDHSDEAKDYLISSIQVFNNPDLDYDGIVAELNGISEAAASLEDELERTLVQGTISVGIESAEYWANEGIYEWASTWGISNPGDAAERLNWGGVAKEDMKGGIKGAIIGIIVSGPGFIPYAFGSAVAASAVEILDQLDVF